MQLEDPQAWEADIGATRVLFGAGALERLGDLAREVGARRALVVTDPGVREAGHVGVGARSLREAAVEPFVYDSVEEDPTTRHVADGVAMARERGVDCIVGLGGGSAMDCAKGINFVLTNGGRMEDYWGSGKAARPMLPSLGVPTTAGTGSEAQSYALILQEGSRVKMACGDKKAMFRRVILDPVLVSTVPREVAAAAGIDAVSHAVESYVSNCRNPVSCMLAREAWRLLSTQLPGALDSPGDIAGWGRMLLGAHLAGAAIEQSMLGAAHACANPLTSRFRVTHGIAVGLMLPHVIRFNAAHAGKLYDELQAATGGAEPALLEDRVRDLRARAGLPEKLRDYSIPRGCLGDLAVEAEGQWTAGYNPRPVTRKEFLELYESAF